MYRRPKFLEVLIEIRQEMAREADFDVDLFAEIVRSGRRSSSKTRYSILDAQDADDVSHAQVLHAAEKGRPLTLVQTALN